VEAVGCYRQFAGVTNKKPGRIRARRGKIQRESTSFEEREEDLSIRLRSQLKIACTGCRKAVSTPMSMMMKMATSGMLSCENMVGYSCSHYVGTRSLDASSHVFDERMFILRCLICAKARLSRLAGLSPCGCSDNAARHLEY
jgi:hypothetical protein